MFLSEQRWSTSQAEAGSSFSEIYHCFAQRTDSLHSNTRALHSTYSPVSKTTSLTHSLTHSLPPCNSFSRLCIGFCYTPAPCCSAVTSVEDIVFGVSGVLNGVSLNVARVNSVIIAGSSGLRHSQFLDCAERYANWDESIGWMSRVVGLQGHVEPCLWLTVQTYSSTLQCSCCVRIWL